MGASAFSSGEAIGVGWRTFKTNIWLMIGAFLLFMVMKEGLGEGLGVLVDLAGKDHSPEQIVQKLREVEAALATGSTVPQAVRQIGISEQTYYRWRKLYGTHALYLYAALGLVLYVLNRFGRLGFTHLALRVVDGEEATIGDLFSQGRLLVRAVLATIVYVGIVIGGFLLLIVPGIIWGIKFQYYIYAIVDEDAGVMESLKRSSALTRGEKLNLFWYGLLCGLVGLLGALALCVGVLAAAPTIALASAYVYRRLVASDAERREFVWPE